LLVGLFESYDNAWTSKRQMNRILYY